MQTPVSIWQQPDLADYHKVFHCLGVLTMALGSTPSRPPVKLAIKPVMLTAVTLCQSHLERYLGLAFKAML